MVPTMKIPFLSTVYTLLRRIGDRVPLTWRGALVALFSGIALSRMGYASLDLLVFVIGIAGLVLVGLAMVTTLLAALRLRDRLRQARSETLRLEAGSRIRTGFAVPSLGRWPLVQVSWNWLTPRGVECKPRRRGSELLEEVVAHRRCEVEGIRRRFEISDAFGLSRLAWERDEASPVTVLPDVGRLRRTAIVQSVVAAEGLPHPAGTPDGDRMEIRRYVPGDSVRFILWKTFARTRQLNVRVPEKSIDPGKRTVAYLLTGPGDEAAAAAARVALESGALGERWLFGADGASEPVDSLGDALAAIARSGSVADRRGVAGRGVDDDVAGLARFLAHPEVRDERHCIVFASSRDGAWRRHALDTGQRFSGSLSFVLGTDGIDRSQAPSLWRRWLLTPKAVEGTSADELSKVLAALGSAGWPATVVDRRDGRSLDGRLGLLAALGPLASGGTP